MSDDTLRRWNRRIHVGVVLLGMALWFAFIGLLSPVPFVTEWAHVLLLLAPLVLVPLTRPLLYAEEDPYRWGFPSTVVICAFLLANAYLPWRRDYAALYALPWLLVASLVAVQGIFRLRQHLGGPVSELCFATAEIGILVGAIWVLFDRLEYRPLGFNTLIVLLTGIHFHYAGFVLPIITGLLLRGRNDTLAWVTGLGVILGIPLVAVGITTTQLNAGGITMRPVNGWELPEFLSVWVLALAALLVAGQLAVHALKTPASWLVKVCWLVAALSLAFSMLLAALYGSRFYLPDALLNNPWMRFAYGWGPPEPSLTSFEEAPINWMRALHGTANALGFALFGLIGWWLHLDRTPPGTTLISPPSPVTSRLP